MTEDKQTVVIIESDPRHIETAKKHFAERVNTDTLNSHESEDPVIDRNNRGLLDYLVLNRFDEIQNTIIDKEHPLISKHRYGGTKPKVYGVILSTLPSYNWTSQEPENRQDRATNCAELAHLFWKAGTPFVLATDLSFQGYHGSNRKDGAVTRMDHYARRLAEDYGAELAYGKDDASPPEKDWRLAFEMLREQVGRRNNLINDWDGKSIEIELAPRISEDRELGENKRIVITGGVGNIPYLAICLKKNRGSEEYEPHCTPLR